ncbi:MAG: hypothetical protein M3400_13260, partial [Actinomycetota bacterium]|nr:hypothetical protein [Actinomycetota bacterium]
MSTQHDIAGFGPNEWLVDEMYQQYLAAPDSVDEAWHEFFADYSPPSGSQTDNGAPADKQSTAGNGAPAAQPSPAAPTAEARTAQAPAAAPTAPEGTS